MNFSFSLTLMKEAADHKSILKILKQLYHFQVFSIFFVTAYLYYRLTSRKDFLPLWQELRALRFARKYVPC